MIDFKNIEKYQENNRIEAKKALGGLPHSIWETYSAFANTLGGIILLGVEEHGDKSLHPIDLPDPELLIEDFWEIIHDSRQVSTNILSEKDVTVELIDGKRIVAIRVPRAQRYDKPVFVEGSPFTGTYRRNGEGDYRCTKEEVQAMMRDAAIQAQDMAVLEDRDLTVLDFDSVRRYRTRMEADRPGHAWEGLEDVDFLYKLGAVGKSRDGQMRPTAAGLLMGLEFACTAIPSSSMFAVLRYVNVFSYVDFIPVFSRYLNISVFGGLISGSDLVLAILPVLCLIFAGLNVLIVERKHPISASNRLLHWADGMVRKLDPKLPRCGEFGKLLVKRKGAILLAVLAIVAIRMEEPPRAYVPYDPYIQHYQSEFAGPITEDTRTALEEALTNAMDTGNQIGLQTVLDSAQNAPDGAWILPTAPYDAIWSNNLDNYHRRTALITMLFLVLTLAPIGSQERQNNMTVLLTSTSGGRKRLWFRKQVVLLVVTAFVWLMVYGGELIHTVNAYGAFQCLSAPAFSLELFRNAPSIPLGGMLALYYGAKLLVLLVIGEICFALSSRCSKNRDAILVCCAVLLIPAALAAIGSVVGEYLSFLIPLSGM